MTKEELKTYIQSLEVPEELEKLLIQMVDSAEQVDEELLEAVASVIDLQAEFYEKEADIMEEEADEYDDLSDKLSLLDEEEYTHRAVALRQSQEELLSQINQKLQEVQSVDVSAGQISDIQKELLAVQQPPTAPQQ